MLMHNDNDAAMLKEEIEFISNLIKSVKHQDKGLFVEIGAWKGVSTVAFANACYPHNLHVIDHWQGQTDEGEDHHTVEYAKENNVFEIFNNRVNEKTNGNVTVHLGDAIEILESEWKQSIQFVCIDAGHSYEVTRDIIKLVKRFTNHTSIICGHDFLTAHRGRTDLNGGVERAVRECFPYNLFSTFSNVWYARMSL